VGQLEDRLAADPNDWRIQYWYGRRAAEVGEFERAEPALRRALGTQPDFLPAATDLGKVLLARGHVEEAFQVLSMAVGRNPADIEAKLALGQLYRSQEAYHRAMDVLEEILKSQPRHVRALYEMAACRSGVQQLEAAEQNLRRALRVEPKNVLVLTALSRVRRERSDVASAESLARQAVRLAPGDPAPLLELGRALALKQPLATNRREAIAILEKARALAPGHPGVLFDLGRLHLAAGECAEAASHLEQVLRLSPDNTPAYYLLSRAFDGLGRPRERDLLEATFKRKQKYERAIADLGSRLGANPENAALRYKLGEVHAAEGYLDRAISAYRIGLQWDPRNDTARQRLAQLVRAGMEQRRTAVSSP
jgi:tetratricopeptide (TPR) repeat protein